MYPYLGGSVPLAWGSVPLPWGMYPYLRVVYIYQQGGTLTFRGVPLLGCISAPLPWGIYPYLGGCTLTLGGVLLHWGCTLTLGGVYLPWDVYPYLEGCILTFGCVPLPRGVCHSLGVCVFPSLGVCTFTQGHAPLPWPQCLPRSSPLPGTQRSADQRHPLSSVSRNEWTTSPAWATSHGTRWSCKCHKRVDMNKVFRR